VKQSLEQSTKSFLIKPVQLFLLLLALFSLTLPFSGCVKRSPSAPSAIKTTQPKANDQQSGTSPQAADSTNQTNSQLININTAPARELEQLPGIGKGLAARIIEHREKWGAFRRPEHLIAVRGISDRRFRALRDSITVP
jgi:competence ComEA-like helix-hairpin-helix protein